MKAIAVRGLKKTGKTTTCEKIISELVKRGYRVGSAKDTHFDGFSIDDPGTDTWKHGEAGASTTIISGNDETDVIYRRKIDIIELIDLYEEDYLIVEGDIGRSLPNIVTGRTVDDLDKRRDENTVCFSGIISSEIDTYEGMPVLSGISEIEKLVDIIEERSEEL